MRNFEDVHIRPLSEHDVEILGNLYFPWSTKEETIAKWFQYFEEQKQGIRKSFILFDKDRVAGYGHLTFCSKYPPFFNKKIPEIQDLWVFEEYRKKGFGSNLIRYLEEFAAKQGYKQIGIGVGLYRDYGQAQRLYIRLGFFPDGCGMTYKYDLVVPGGSYPIDDDSILWFVKDLV